MSFQINAYFNVIYSEIKDELILIASEYDEAKVLRIAGMVFACIALLCLVKKSFFTAKVIKFNGKEMPFSEVVWKGESSDKIFVGRGRVDLPDGTSYEGVFSNGWLVDGTMTQNDCIMKGTFKEGELHGEGELTILEDRYCYRGTFEEGYLEGRGSITETGGAIFTGHFIRSEMCGKFDVRYANGTTGVFYPQDPVQLLFLGS